MVTWVHKKDESVRYDAEQVEGGGYAMYVIETGAYLGIIDKEFFENTYRKETNE